MDEFFEYFRTHQEFLSKKEEKEKELSKRKLRKVAETKIRTTMIGALSSVEKHLQPFWDVSNPSPEQQEMKEVFEQVVRPEILDRGNNQMRNLGNEFESYDIIYKKKVIMLPVKEKPE